MNTSQLEPTISRAWIKHITDELMGTFDCDASAAERAATAAFQIGGRVEEATHYLFSPEELAWVEQNGAPVTIKHTCFHCKRGFQTDRGYEQHRDERPHSGSCKPSGKGNKGASPRSPRSQQQQGYARQTNPLDSSYAATSGGNVRQHSYTEGRPASSPPRHRANDGGGVSDNHIVRGVGDAWNATGGHVMNAMGSAWNATANAFMGTGGNSPQNQRNPEEQTR